jgi:hypothetical protein
LCAFVVGTFAYATMGMGHASHRAPADEIELASFDARASRVDEPTGPAPAEAGPSKLSIREPSALTPRLRARGYNACFVPETGFGSYSHWQRVGMGQMIMPLRGGRTESGGYDIVIHFHGRDAVRHAFVEVARGTVLVGIDLGSSSAPYQRAFERPEAFTGLLDRVTRGLVAESGDPRAHIRHLAVSSWSAGQGAVRAIVSQFASRIDAVVLLDSLHSGYEPGSTHGVWSAPIAGIADYAARAANGEGFLFLSHSQIVPPGYPSTTEVADYILAAVNGTRTPRQGRTPLGAELVSGFDRRGMHARGYLGADKAAHCAHVELLAEVVRDFLEPAWGTPSPDAA